MPEPKQLAIELCKAHRGSYGTCDTCGEYLPCACSDCECREVHVMPTTHAVKQEGAPNDG